MAAHMLAGRSALMGATRAMSAKNVRASRAVAPVRATAEGDNLGFKTMRKGVKEASDDTVLTPRFYTTDFDEMEQLFSQEINPELDMEELEAMLEEFRLDYNQRHFVRNETFRKAADKIDGPARRIFVEFLERSCTAEFSGFLLYKELGRRLKTTNPVVAEIFTLMSRDEARHAGFINKAMSDFDLALDLGFLTKNRKYTFFKPKFIFYATYLSEKIGYWRYISIYRHLQRNPDNQLYPLFEYFENWCQDENRHGDFFSAILKVQPQFVNTWQSKLWSKFFCHSVYITMYLNDHQRSAFYESLGLDTTVFNQHVIYETNNTTMRIFPECPDVTTPEYWAEMDKLVELNTKLNSGEVNAIEKFFITAQMVGGIVRLFFQKSVQTGSYDLADENALVY